MIQLALFLAAAALAPDASDIIVTAPVERPLSGPRVPNTQLALMRGGLRLPNGFDVAIGIDIQTRVDGVLALHTIYLSEGPQAGIRVFTDGTDAPRIASGTSVVESAGQTGAPDVNLGRTPSGPTIVANRPVPATTVNLVSGAPATWLMGTGQIAIPVEVDGPAVVAAPGTVSVASSKAGAVVTLDAPMLRIQQLIGQATGVVVANRGNDRAIDTVSSVNVDLQGLSPVTMSAIFAVQRAALDSVRR